MNEMTLQRIQFFSSAYTGGTLIETQHGWDALWLQIVKCFGAYDTMGEISFVLELMDAGSLADVIKATVCSSLYKYCTP